MYAPNATRVYGEATGSAASAPPSARRLDMAGPLVRVAAQIVIDHECETEPYGKSQAHGPGHRDAPEDPVGHAEGQADVIRRTPVAVDIGVADAPDQGQGPDGHDNQALAAGMAEQLLFFAGGFGRV